MDLSITNKGLRSNIFKSIVLAVCVIMFISFFAMGKEPLLEYLFNETGNQALSTGSNKTPLVMGDYNFKRVDLHTEGGLGVSGSLNDRAFDNYSWREPGSKGGVAFHEQAINEISDLKSFTFQGWYKVDQNGLQTDQRLCAGPFGLYGWFGNALDFQVGTTRKPSAYQYTARNEWAFFAITYDSTKTNDNVSYYVGTKGQPVKVVSTHTNTNPIAKSNLKIGAIDIAGAYAFYGYLDNIRLYGSKQDSTGVLSIAELEKIRVKDSILLPDPNFSTAKAEPVTCLADGEHAVTITVFVADSNKKGISERNVTLEKVDGDLNFKPMSKTTNNEGAVTFEIGALKTGKITLNVSVDSGYGLEPIILKDKVSFEFVGN